MIPVLALLFWGCDLEEELLGPKVDELSKSKMVGVWVPIEGKKDSYLHFWEEKKQMIGAVTAIEGRGEIQNCMGYEHLEFGWNYENWDPLRLNIVAKEMHTTAALKVTANGQMLVRFSDNIEDLSGPKIFKTDTTKFNRKISQSN